MLYCYKPHVSATVPSASFSSYGRRFRQACGTLDAPTSLQELRVKKLMGPRWVLKQARLDRWLLNFVTFFPVVACFCTAYRYGPFLGGNFPNESRV